MKKSIPLLEGRQMSASRNDDDSDDAPLKPKADKIKMEIDEARERSWQAVKRKHEEASKLEEQSAAIGERSVSTTLRRFLYDDFSFSVKPKLKKVERRLVPVIEMLSVDELMETNTYQRFNRLIDAVFEVVDDENFLNDAGALRSRRLESRRPSRLTLFSLQRTETYLTSGCCRIINFKNCAPKLPN